MDEIPGRLRELVRPERSALLIIDMQKDFCEPAFARRDVSMTALMIPNLLALIGAGRAAGVPIVHIRTEHTPATDSDVSLGGPRSDGHALPPLARSGTPGIEFVDGFAPLATEIVVTKRRYSGFVGTDLDLILRSLGIRTIVVTGVQTNNCVEATARDGMMLDYWLIFVSDATATYDRSLHDATLKTMANHYGEVVTVRELTGAWERQPAVIQRG